VSLETTVILRMANESKRTPPKAFISRELAVQFCDARMGSWNAKGTVFTLSKVEHEMWKPAPSLTPGKLMDDFVDGDALAIAAINAYAPMLRAA
jgi:hypothetical protein